MLAFLIDRCGAEPAELPQLVRLNELMRAEDAVPAAAARPAPTPAEAAYTLPALPPPPPPSAVAPAVAPTAVTGHATEPLDPSRDPTALGFLLHRCVADAEERAQCAVLQQLHGWLLADLQAASGNSAVELNLPPVPPPPAKPQVRAASDTPSSRTSAHAGASKAATAPPPPPPAATLAIPVPIVPGAGDWKGSITVAPPPPPPPPQLASSTPETETDESAILRPRRTTLPAKPLELHTYEDAAVDHNGCAAGASDAAAASPSAQPPTRPVAPHATAYAGRMPCPASEALAARHSATVRLLSGAAVGAVASATPASRPSSAFARRFMAGLYERVTTPRGGGSGGSSSAASALPLQPTALYHDHHLPLPPFGVAHGSGVRAARDRRASGSDAHNPPSAVAAAAEPWRARPHAGRRVRPSSAAAWAVPAAQTHTGARPPHRSPAPPTAPVGPQGSVVRRSPRHVPHPPAPPTPSSAAAAATSPHRPPRRHSPAPLSVPPKRGESVGAPAAVAESPLTGLVVVGARICLPSVAPTRPRYA